jgi:hypothetical protein
MRTFSILLHKRCQIHTHNTNSVVYNRITKVPSLFLHVAQCPGPLDDVMNQCLFIVLLLI